MACRLVGAKPLSEPMLEYCQLDPWDKLQRNFNQNSYIFIQESAFENVVWKMAAIFSRPQCVNQSLNDYYLSTLRMGLVEVISLRWWEHMYAIAAAGLATQGTVAPEAMELTYFAWYITFSVPKGYIYTFWLA